jgi:Polyphosphate kinase 2 (PPK2)
MAALRTAVIGILRVTGVTNIAAANRHHARAPVHCQVLVSVSRREQQTRFVIRQVDPVRRWKLSPADWPHWTSGMTTPRPRRRCSSTGTLPTRRGRSSRALLVVPPDTPRTAEAAMALAATASNRIHAQYLLAAAADTPSARPDGGLPEQVWETEGGHLHTAGRPRIGPESDEQTRGAQLVTVEYRR